MFFKEIEASKNLGSLGMAALDRLAQLKNSGMQDSDIVTQLRNEGFSPVEINDALTQSQIKEAVSSSDVSGQNYPQEQNPPQGYEAPPYSDMNQSIADSQVQSEEILYPEQTEQAEQPAEGGEYYAEAPQTYYGEQQPAEYGESLTEIAEQIAEQVVLEKLNEFQEKTGDLSLFRQDVNDKIQDLNKRLTRIEDSIERLQNAVIQKIGDFGEDASSIHKDLEMLHSTTSKLMNPLIDNYSALKEILRGREEKFLPIQSPPVRQEIRPDITEERKIYKKIIKK